MNNGKKEKFKDQLWIAIPQLTCTQIKRHVVQKLRANWTLEIQQFDLQKYSILRGIIFLKKTQ